MRVVLAGATGLIGTALAPKLLAAGHDLHRLQRRASGGAGEEHVAPSSDWPAVIRRLRPEVAISAIGTTMRKAGSQAGFRTVDLALVTCFAAAARDAGATHMVAVSSVGADLHSRNFYLRVKGEMEEALKALGFQRFDAFRPGLLRGVRGGDRRLGERIGIAVSPLTNLLLRGPLDRFAAIDSEMVADAIVQALNLEIAGFHIHHNRDIRRLAGA